MLARFCSGSAPRSLAAVVAFAPFVGCIAGLTGFRCGVDSWDVEVVSIEVDGSTKDADVIDERALWGTTGLLTYHGSGTLDFLPTDGSVGLLFLEMEP